MKPVLAVALVLALPNVAFAGMPSIGLSDIAALRLREISFLAGVCLLGAAAIQVMWNSLRTDFPRLPRLGYGRALGLVALQGCVLLLVLSLIAGARELVTPGAWKKDGLTYKLAEPLPDSIEPERRRRLEALRSALWRYAEGHGGALPANDAAPDVAPELWRVVAHPGAARFGYAGGRRVGETSAVAWEPGAFGDRRLVLLASGEIVLGSPDQPR